MSMFFNKAVSLLLLMLGLPFVLLILITVFFITGQFPIIIQRRMISLQSKVINLFKIRTIIDSDLFTTLEKKSDNPFFKDNFKVFIPAFCKWLRRTGLDEILQLINVLKGEMYLVGPRPFLENDLKLLKENSPDFYYQRTLLRSKPGITGLWQVLGDRKKGAFDLLNLGKKYELNRSFKLDLLIIYKTILIMLTAGHSDSILQKKCSKNLKEENTSQKKKNIIPINIQLTQR